MHDDEDDDGRWMTSGPKRLAKNARISKTAVSKGRDALIDAGMLIVERRRWVLQVGGPSGLSGELQQRNSSTSEPEGG